MFEQDLARSDDMPGGMQGRGGPKIQRLRTPEGRRELGAAARQAGVQQPRGGRGAEHLLVPGDVVAMRVRDEGSLRPGLGIEPPADLRQPDALAVMNLPRHAQPGVPGQAGALKYFRLARRQTVTKKAVSGIAKSMPSTPLKAVPQKKIATMMVTG